MEFAYELKTAKEFRQYGENALQIAILEAYNTHSRGDKTTKVEKFLCGLLFSEFYAEYSSDEDLNIAYDKQQVFYKVLGINNEMKFKGEIHKMAGWPSAKYYI